MSEFVVFFVCNAISLVQNRYSNSEHMTTLINIISTTTIKCRFIWTCMKVIRIRIGSIRRTTETNEYISTFLGYKFFMLFVLHLNVRFPFWIHPISLTTSVRWHSPNPVSMKNKYQPKRWRSVDNEMLSLKHHLIRLNVITNPTTNNVQCGN